MSREEITAEQIRAAQAGDSDAMWRIVLGCDAMLRGIVRSVAPGANREDAEDYLQEARAVLIQHVRDYSSEVSAATLTSYVYLAAKRAVVAAYIATSCPVAVPTSTAIVVRHLLYKHAGDVERVWEELEEETRPTFKISRDVFLALLEALAEPTSFDAPVNGDDADGTSLTLADVVADLSSEVTLPTERRDLARWLMTQIPPRQALALRAFYGVGMTQQEEPETCADLAIKPAALRQLRSNGTKSARKVAAAHGLTA